MTTAPQGRRWITSAALDECLLRCEVPDETVEPHVTHLGGKQWLDAQGMLCAVASWRRDHRPAAGPRLLRWDAARLPYALRADQQAAADAVVQPATVPVSGVVVAPTNWGKTLLAIECMRRYGRRAVVVTVSAEVLKQWKDSIEKCGVTVGVIGEECVWLGDGPLEPPDVTLLTYQVLGTKECKRGRAASRHVSQLKANVYGLLVLDEVHRLPAKSYSAAVGKLRTVLYDAALGLTATPFRLDGGIERLKGLVGPVLHRGTRHAEAPRLRQRVIRVQMPPRVEAAHARARQLQRRLLAAINPSKLVEMARICSAEPSKSIVFAGLLAALSPVADALRERVGVPVFGPVSYASSAAEREATFRKFRSADRGTLVVSDIASVGLDIPDVALVVEITTDASKAKYYQRAGRARGVGRNSVCVVSLVSIGTAEEKNISSRSSQGVEAVTHCVSNEEEERCIQHACTASTMDKRKKDDSQISDATRPRRFKRRRVQRPHSPGI